MIPFPLPVFQGGPAGGLVLIESLPADTSGLPDPATLPLDTWYGYTAEAGGRDRYVVTEHPDIPSGGSSDVVGAPILSGPLADLAALEVAFPAASNQGLFAIILDGPAWALAVDTGWGLAVSVVDGDVVPIPIPVGDPPIGSDLEDLTDTYPPGEYEGELGAAGLVTYYSDGASWLEVTWYTDPGAPNTWET